MADIEPEKIQLGMEQGAALDEHAPYATWPRDVQKLWLTMNSPRIVRELRFLHLAGMAMCLLCIPLDALANVLLLGTTVRLAVVIPAYLLGIWLLQSRHSSLRLVGAMGPIAVFAGAVSLIGMEATGQFSDRYIMAASMLVSASIVHIPLSVRLSSWLSASGFLAIALPLLLVDSAAAQSPDLLIFAFLCCTFPLIFKRRSDRLRDQNFILSLKSRQAQAQLLTINKELEDLSQMDPLTGLLNRRGFERRFSAAFEEAQASGEPLAVVLLDIDHFKHFNDTYGHQLGDECLAQIGTLLKSEIKQHKGFAGRYGGEEFIATLMGSKSANAVSISERLRKKIADLEILDNSGNRITVTASFGARIARAAKLRRHELIRDADKALYAAKKEGRNRVALYQGGGKSLKQDVEIGGSHNTRYEARPRPLQPEAASPRRKRVL